MDGLAGKVAVVTGAASGIGRGLALRFASEGMRVALGDIDVAGLETTRQLIAAATPDATTSGHHVDVADAASVDAFADSVFARYGQVDLLCNNAGVFLGGYLWDRSVAEMEFILGVNLWGILNGIRSFVPRMIAQDTEGHIVNTSSVAGIFGSPAAGPYTISKFAAFAATETLAGDLEMAGSKLRASVLCPGIVATDIARTAADRLAADRLAADRFAADRPEADRDDAPADQRFVTDMLVELVPGGLDPADVADMVVGAIRAQTFLILTHENHAPQIVRRAQDLEARRLPAIGEYT